MRRLADSEPTLALSMVDGQVHVECTNVSEVKGDCNTVPVRMASRHLSNGQLLHTQVSLAFYKMDIELLFSTSPFAFGDDASSSGSSSSGGGSTYSLFSSVRPNATLSGLALPADGSPLEVALPTSVAGADVMVECKSGSGLRQQVVHNSCEFRLTVHSTMGMARVTRKDTNRPLSGAYVKVEYSSVARVVFDVWPLTLLLSLIFSGLLPPQCYRQGPVLQGRVRRVGVAVEVVLKRWCYSHSVTPLCLPSATLTSEACSTTCPSTLTKAAQPSALLSWLSCLVWELPCAMCRLHRLMRVERMIVVERVFACSYILRSLLSPS